MPTKQDMYNQDYDDHWKSEVIIKFLYLRTWDNKINFFTERKKNMFRDTKFWFIYDKIVRFWHKKMIYMIGIRYLFIIPGKKHYPNFSKLGPNTH